MFVWLSGWNWKYVFFYRGDGWFLEIVKDFWIMV